MWNLIKFLAVEGNLKLGVFWNVGVDEEKRGLELRESRWMEIVKKVEE